MMNTETHPFQSRMNHPILDRARMHGHTRILLLMLGAILLAEAVITGARLLF